jgi:hypothetical protein
MEAPTGRRKKIIIIAGVTAFAVIVAAALAIGLALGLKQNGAQDAPTASLEENVQLHPKILAYDDVPDAEPGHWSFVLENTGEAPLQQIMDDFHTKPEEKWEVTEQYDNLGIFMMKCTKDVLINSAIPLPAMQQNVLYIEPVYRRRVNVSRAVGTLWGLDRLDQVNPTPLDNTYNVPGNANGAGVTVYVLDTGLRATHTEFTGRVAAGQDFIGDGQGTNDCNGHGTHVSGTVLGTKFGVATGAKVAPVRVLGCDGSGSGQGVINGINWVTQNAKKPAVASMSLGGGRSATENAAVERAIAAGIPFAVAAGNENADACNTSPASATNAITVGAMDKTTDNRASYSNWGTCLDIFAPGTNIESASFNSDTGSVVFSGTSMATPHVAGVMALILGKNPTFTAAQVNSALINGATTNKVKDVKGSVNRLLNVAFLAGGTAATSAATSAATPATSAPATTGTAATTKTETGSITTRGTAKFHPGGSFFQTTTAKTLTAQLVGPTNADFDLALQRWVNNAWTIVVNSEGSTSRESISSVQPAGFYSWRVLNFNGAGSYTITFTNA